MGINEGFGKKYIKEFNLADLKLHFILHFFENFNLEMKVDRGTVIRLVVFFVLPAHFAMMYFFLAKHFVLSKYIDYYYYYYYYYYCYYYYYYYYYNHGHNIVRIFDVSPNFPFTPSETKPDY